MSWKTQSALAATVPVVLLTIAFIGCSTDADVEATNEVTNEQGGSNGQLGKDKQLIEQAIRMRHPGSSLRITKWHQHETYYVAFQGPIGQEGYSGISHVSTREEALESVRETNRTIRELQDPGEELVEFELKKLEPIGIKIKVEYELGSGSDKSVYRDNYLVTEDVSLRGGKLVRQNREATLNGSSMVSGNSSIRDGSAD